MRLDKKRRPRAAWRKRRHGDSWGDFFDGLTTLSELEWLPGARRMTPSPSLTLYELAYQAGSIAALYDAIRFCGGHRLPMPQWLTLATLKEIREARVQGVNGDHAGRHARWEGGYHDDQRHLKRWRAVERARGRPRGYAPRYQPRLSQEAAIEQAALDLDTTESTIVESHKLIQRLRKSPGVFRLYTARK